MLAKAARLSLLSELLSVLLQLAAVHRTRYLGSALASIKCTCTICLERQFELEPRQHLEPPPVLSEVAEKKLILFEKIVSLRTNKLEER